MVRAGGRFSTVDVAGVVLRDYLGVRAVAKSFGPIRFYWTDYILYSDHLFIISYHHIVSSHKKSAGRGPDRAGARHGPAQPQRARGSCSTRMKKIKKKNPDFSATWPGWAKIFAKTLSERPPGSVPPHFLCFVRDPLKLTAASAQRCDSSFLLKTTLEPFSGVIFEQFVKHAQLHVEVLDLPLKSRRLEVFSVRGRPGRRPGYLASKNLAPRSKKQQLVRK